MKGTEVKAKEFKEIRNKLKLTQAQLAKQLDLSIRAIQTYEQNQIKVPKLVSKVMLLLLTNSYARKVFLNENYVLYRVCPCTKQKCSLYNSLTTQDRRRMCNNNGDPFLFERCPIPSKVNTKPL